MKPPRNEREALSAVDYRISGDGASKIGANFAKPGPRRVRAGGVKLDTGAMPLDAFAAASIFEVSQHEEDQAQADFLRRYRENYPPRKRRSTLLGMFGRVVGVIVIACVLTALVLQYFGVLTP